MFDFKKLRENKEDYLNFFRSGDKLGSLLGHQIIDLTKQSCLSEYRVKEEHLNPNGILHGGALYTTMDSAQGAFVHFMLPEIFEFAATGTATIKYFAPLTQGVVSLETVLREQQGRKLFVDTIASQDQQKVAELNEIWIAKGKTS